MRKLALICSISGWVAIKMF